MARSNDFISSLYVDDSSGAIAAIPVTGEVLAGSKPMHVAIVDGSGAQITSFGGTQYAEDSVHTSGHLGTMSLAVYNTVSALASPGDYTPLSTDGGGNLRTALYSGNAEIASSPTGGDGGNNTSRGLRVYNRNEVFNGTTFDRLRGDVRGVHISDIKDSAGDSLIDAANNALQVNIVAGAEVQDSFSIDAFGRWRISDTGQRFDCEFLYDKQPSLMDEVLAGAGTVTHNATSRDLTLAVVDAVDASSAMMVQHWHNPYTPGNSQLIDITGTMDAANLGTGTASIVLRDGITSTEVVVAQADWHAPNLDLDWTTSQILQIDFQSLKVGRLRINLVRDGLPIQVHAINNDNMRIEGYWQYAALPTYWKIYNAGGATISEMGYGDDTNGIFLRYTIATANATAKLQAICTTVKSEGGDKLLDMVGYTRTADMGVTAKTVSTTLIPIISIRPSATFNSIVNRSLIIPEGFEIGTDNPVRYVWLLKPTLTGAVFNSVGASHSAVDVDTTATAVTGGIPIASGYVKTDKNVDAGVQGLLGRAPLSLNNTGTADILTLAMVRSGGTNAEVLASVNWKEIR